MMPYVELNYNIIQYIFFHHKNFSFLQTEIYNFFLIMSNWTFYLIFKIYNSANRFINIKVII